MRGPDEPRKEFIAEAEAIQSIPGRLEIFQDELLAAAIRRREENSHRGVTSIGELTEILDGEGGFVYTGWSGDPAVEARIKEEAKGTLRCIPTEEFRSGTAPERCIGGDVPAEFEDLADESLSARVGEDPSCHDAGCHFRCLPV